MASRRTKRKKDGDEAHRPRDHVHVLEVDEVERVMRTAEKAGPREHAMIATAYQFGLRAGELGKLRLDQLDIGRRELYVEAEKDGKTGVQSFAASPVDLERVLRAWSAVHPGGPWLFPSLSDPQKGVHRSVVWATYRKVALAAGLPKRAAYTHILRNSIVTNLLDAGAEPTYVQRHVRHRALETTLSYRKYSRAARDSGRAAMERIGTAMRSKEPSVVELGPKRST